MRTVRRLRLTAFVLVAISLSVAAAAILFTPPSHEPGTATYLAHAGDTIAFEGTRTLPFEVMGDVDVTIRGTWTATAPTVVTPDWNYIGTPMGWPGNLPKSLGGSIEFTQTFRVSLPDGSNYPNGAGPVTCFLVLNSSVPDTVTALTDITVTYTRP